MGAVKPGLVIWGTYGRRLLEDGVGGMKENNGYAYGGKVTWGGDLNQWFEYLYTIRYGWFIKGYIDLGVYRWNKADKVECTGQNLGFPSIGLWTRIGLFIRRG